MIFPFQKYQRTLQKILTWKRLACICLILSERKAIFMLTTGETNHKWKRAISVIIKFVILKLEQLHCYQLAWTTITFYLIYRKGSSLSSLVQSLSFCLISFSSKAMSQSSSLFPILLSGSPFSHHSGVLVILKICKALPVSTSFPLFSLPRALFSGSLPLSASPHCVFYKSGSSSKRSLLLPVSTVIIFPPRTLHPILWLDLATLALSF